MIEYQIARDGDVLRLTLRGDQRDPPSREQREHLTRSLELELPVGDDRVRTICVGLGQIERINHPGIGLLAHLWVEARRRGKDIVVEEARGQVRAKLRATGLLARWTPQASSGRRLILGRTLTGSAWADVEG